MKACYRMMASVTDQRFSLLSTLCLLASLLLARPLLAEEYLSQAEFLRQAFGEVTPTTQTLWLTNEHKQAGASILGHPYNGMRLRYWQSADAANHDRRAWIVEEIGKERPITIGVITQGQTVADVVILAFRESRGWEVRNRFFTEQFANASINAGHDLSHHVDGITGATLSVRAVTNSVRWVLYLNQQTPSS